MVIEKLTPRGLERRIKKQFNNTPQIFSARVVPGFERYASAEIEQLPDATVTRREKGVVEFTGPVALVYHANLKLRTVNRVTMQIGSSITRSYPELYNKLRRIPWETYLGFSPSVAIVVSSKQSRLHHTGNIAETAQSALRDHLEPLGITVRDGAATAVRIFIRLHDDTCSVAVDSTGELLYKRGYRKATGRAPLRETSAAALLIAAGFDHFPVVVDPCCGSGTFIIEALQMALGSVPGVQRSFAFEHWPVFNESHFTRIKSTAAAATRTAVSQRFIASDSDAAMVEHVEKNSVSLVGKSTFIVRHADCLDFNRQGEEGSKGLIISNLPYGKRVGNDGDISLFYRKLGEWLRRACKGWHFGFVVAADSFEHDAMLRSSRVISFSNGGIPVRFVMGKVS